jgi:type IV pilus assembly protein PilM
VIFRKKRVKYLGLDIGSTAVKLVQLVKEANQLQVSSYAQVVIHRAEKQTTEEAVEQAIQTALNTINTQSRQVVTALPDITVASQRLQIDPTIADREAAVLLAAAPSIPQPLDTVHLDFQVLEDAVEETVKLSVLCVSCSKEVVYKRLQLLANCRLKLSILEVNSHALERVFQYFYQITVYKYWMLVDIGIRTATFLLWEKQQVRGTYSIYLQDLCTFELLVIQIYQALNLLLLTYSVSHLDNLYFIGGNIPC